MGGETEYAFLHLLVRDVAYGQIPRAGRAKKHGAAAEWIASLGTDRLEDRAELLAHHYLSALELARATGSDTSELEGLARHALRAAGERALELNSFAPAIRYFDAALELWPVDDPERPHVLYGHGRAHWAGAATGVESLEAARDGFLRLGALENAAAAETIRGEIVWAQGRAAAARTPVHRAAAMLAEQTRS